VSADAERVWWARVERAGERKGLIGEPGLFADWSHNVLRVLVPQASGSGVPAEQLTEEYKQAETRRLCDELGRRLGVGPMPR
jgi:hypothetical protein